MGCVNNKERNARECDAQPTTSLALGALQLGAATSGSASDLSNARYADIDVVVALTEASINATMKQYLAQVTNPVVIKCYVYNESNQIVEIAYDELKANAKGSDPFAVADGAKPSDPDVVNLKAALFAGALKASIGLPAVPLNELPPIVTLGENSDDPVTFNLLCSEFQICGFEYGPAGVTVINQSQPVDGKSPLWYFTSAVNLNNSTVDPNSAVPPAVQKRINELIHSVGQGAFGVQNLLLELDTAILLTTPTINGIPQGWPVWNLMSTIFLSAYFGQLQQSGQPVLSYSFSVADPLPSTIQLGALSHQTAPFLVNGKPPQTPTPEQKAASCLAYLGTRSTVAPALEPFTWNWVDLVDLEQISGVIAVRRDDFATYLASLTEYAAMGLCYDTTCSLTHHGDTYYISYYSQPAAKPTSFIPVATPKMDTNGWKVLEMAFTHNSSDSSEDSTKTSSIYGKFNINVSGSISFKGTQIVIVATAQLYMKFNHHELGVNYDDLPGNNYYDKTLTATYDIAVNTQGQLVVTESNTIADNSAAWDFEKKGVLGLFGLEDDLKSGLTGLQGDINTQFDTAFANFASSVASAMNGYQGWVFPGTDSFVMHNAFFSDTADLVTQATYANPNIAL